MDVVCRTWSADSKLFQEKRNETYFSPEFKILRYKKLHGMKWDSEPFEN
jgi:hypothetical protein